ncbi:MAG: DUF6569 family protein [bacterium]
MLDKSFFFPPNYQLRTTSYQQSCIIPTMGGMAAAFLDGFTIKKPIEYGGLAVFPVCRVGDIPADEPETRTLAEGLKSGRVLVYETGRMEAVDVVNMDTAPALIMDGETLVGGAQNRMLHTAAVVGPGERAEMPSSCVEVRRWDVPHSGEPHGGELPPEKARFARSDFAFASLRHQRMGEMERSMRSDNRIAVDQQAVWATIVRKFGVSGAKTDTLDLHELYEEWDAALRAVTDRFHLVPGQTGMIVFLDRETWFADIFFTRDLMQKQYKKILKGIAFEALIRLEAGIQVDAVRLPPSRRPETEHARAALRGLRVARESPTPDGRGRFLSSPKCFGFAALVGGGVACLSACSRKFWMGPASKDI